MDGLKTRFDTVKEVISKMEAGSEENTQIQHRDKKGQRIVKKGYEARKVKCEDPMHM